MVLTVRRTILMLFESARAKGIDVLIADTAGRLQNKANLVWKSWKKLNVRMQDWCNRTHEIAGL